VYGKKAIYFNYKSFGGFIAFILVPALLVLSGGSMAYMFLAWQPIFIGISAAILLSSPGFPRLLAINANADLKENKYKKALKKTGRAVKLPFAPLNVKTFHAYVLLLNGKIPEAKDALTKVKDKEMSYSEKSKWEAINAQLLWVESDNPDEGLKYLEDKDRKGADEAIAYTKGKLLNASDATAAARKYNESSYEMHNANRDILSNLVISYCRTGQTRDAKILFRTLYNDLGCTSDSLYFMANIKETENKYKDAVEFIKAALEIETSATDIANRSQLEKYLEELNRGIYEI